MMLIALELPKALASAVALEAARCGQTPPAWIADRLADRFGLSQAASASRVPVVDPAPKRRP